MTSETTPVLSRTRSSIDAIARWRQRIGLLDHLGHGNLGDDATLDAVMQNIKSRWPQVEIIALTMNPHDTRQRHGIPSYAIRRYWKLPPQADKTQASETTPSEAGLRAKVKRRLSKYPLLLAVLRKTKTIAIRMPRAFFQELSFLVESFSIVRNLDLLVISGGGQLLDSWGGPGAFPYTIFKWVLLARLARVKCYFINLGAGPIDHPSSKWLIKSALFFADYISFRDGNSKALVEKIGFKGKSEVSVDCVYGLDLCEPGTTGSPAPEHPIVGLSPMAYCDPRLYWDRNQSVYGDYIHRFAEFGTWLISRQYRLKLFSTEISFDSQAMEELAIALKNVTGATGSRNIMLEPVDAFQGLLSAIRSSEYIVTCRYHGVVLAHLLNKPVLAISHHHKVATLMNDMGLSDYCVDIRTFDLDLLANTFIRMVENRDKIKTRMAEKAASYRRGLSIQFDQLFPRIQERPLKSS